jgi:hypothetical protein
VDAPHDLDEMTEFFTDDIVLIGDSVENFDRDSTLRLSAPVLVRSCVFPALGGTGQVRARRVFAFG